MLEFKNGIPTKKSLKKALSKFNTNLPIYLTPYYGWHDRDNALLWSSQAAQDSISDLRKYLEGLGVKFGDYRPYNSGQSKGVFTVGRLQILNR